MEQTSERKPDFIIIGAMKCATSALHDQLKAHSSFFMTTPKEPNFFSDDRIFAKGIGWYQSLFDLAQPGQLRGESSTHYTKLPDCPEALPRLISFCPEIKCIYMMRHPVDRLISHYIHKWTQRIISCDINKAVDSFPELIDYGCYTMQIEPYLAAFGPSALLPVFTERFHDNPQQELGRIFAFLGVDEKPVWHADIRSNISAERLQTCAWRDALVRNPLLRFIRRTFVPKKMRTMFKNIWTMKERPELLPEVQKRVVSIFDKDLAVLGSKLGVELHCGNFKNQVLDNENLEWIK